MTSKLPGRWRLPLHLSAVTLLGAMCAACATGRAPSPGCGSNGPPSTPAALKECVTKLGFDTLEAAGDEQPLTVVEKGGGAPCPGSMDTTRSCRYGPIATIQPESTSHLQKLAGLREGRIFAKLFLGPHHKVVYESLALVPGDTTYWWVQVTEKTDSGLYARSLRRGEDHDRYSKGDSVGVSIFISTARGEHGDTLLMKQYPLHYVRHEKKFKQALARWVWDPDDETTQGSCSQGCCR
jgi:hypothetical protein